MEPSKQNLPALRRQVLERDFSRMNDRQKEAVFATEGPLLVLAGAASGKTTVLVNRIANIVRYGRAYHSDDLFLSAPGRGRLPGLRNGGRPPLRRGPGPAVRLCLPPLAGHGHHLYQQGRRAS